MLFRLGDHRAVPGKFQGNGLSLAALDSDAFLDFSKRLHIAPIQVAAAGLLVDIEVFLIDGKDRETEGDLVVMADGNAGQGGLACADDIDTRSVQVRDIAQRRHRVAAVWIIRQNRTTSGCA